MRLDVASSLWDETNPPAFGKKLITSPAVATRVYATWNPSDKAATITLSNANLTELNNTATAGNVRATIGKSSGKWYWEQVVKAASASASPWVGIGTSAALLTAALGTDALGWSWQRNSFKKHNNTNATYGALLATNDIVGIALDMDNGTIEFFKNNVSQGVAYTGITGTIFPMSGAGATNSGWFANFAATALIYTPPAGFNAGVYN